jgi:flagellar biosynthesis/type III secretory pathway M-ring protein FliF/YscJ
VRPLLEDHAPAAQTSEPASAARSTAQRPEEAKPRARRARTDRRRSAREKLGQARALAQQDPKAVANIIKDWTGANAS